MKANDEEESRTRQKTKTLKKKVSIVKFRCYTRDGTKLERPTANRKKKKGRLVRKRKSQLKKRNLKQ